ncbi:hypothetical protein [Heyndrickxia acidicola]|uniref:Transmembrane protein n=1 Tax=Heyndrickxia acidicola TaxID=209389 RepID=A0ABU6MIX5_9BACI|nr:hypothetical protein [Heyndrickxia acidicola]MED1204608.1 hypothetical protein [Heyndrickxia acidicola]
MSRESIIGLAVSAALLAYYLFVFYQQGMLQLKKGKILYPDKPIQLKDPHNFPLRLKTYPQGKMRLFLIILVFGVGISIVLMFLCLSGRVPELTDFYAAVIPSLIILPYYLPFEIREDGIVFRRFIKWSAIGSCTFEYIGVYHTHYTQTSPEETCFTMHFNNYEDKKMTRVLVVTEEQKAKIETLLEHYGIKTVEKKADNTFAY